MAEIVPEGLRAGAGWVSFVNNGIYYDRQIGADWSEVDYRFFGDNKIHPPLYMKLTFTDTPDGTKVYLQPLTAHEKPVQVWPEIRAKWIQSSYEPIIGHQLDKLVEARARALAPSLTRTVSGIWRAALRVLRPG